MLAKYQNWILIGIVLLIAFGIYSYFFTGKEESALTAETIGPASSSDQELISLLLELRAISLDESLFSNPAFQSLQDFSQELVPEAVGRPNPFAPIGSSER